MVGTAPWQHRSSHVQGVTYAIARFSGLAEAPNPLTPQLETNLEELLIRRCGTHVVSALLDINRSNSDVSASLAMRVRSHSHPGVPYHTC